MKIFRYLLFILLTTIAVDSVNAESAQSLLSRTTKKINGTVKASFSISGKQSLKGSFQASGKKFALSAPQMSIWYNGQFMWTYNASTKETTKVKPSMSELAESNPMLFVSQYSGSFKAEYGKAATNTEQVLILTPKTKNVGVERAVLTIDKKTLYPKKLAMRMNGQSVVVTFSSFSVGGNIPSSTFEYPKSKYPNVKIINL